MKRWTIDAPSQSQYHRDLDGEWVEYDDVRDLEQENARLRAAIAEALRLHAGGYEHGHVLRAALEPVSSPANPKG